MNPARRLTASPVLQRAAPLLWALAALGAAWLTPLPRVLPALGLLRGPLGAALFGLAVALSAGRALAGKWRPPEPAPAALFGLAAVLYLGVGLSYTSRLRVSGDEPHYLLMAQSLWREADLDLRDNLAREDWREYTPGPIAPHFGAPRRDGRPYPAHSPGLPLLLAPVYAVAGRRGCAAALALMAAALTVQVRMLAVRLGGSAPAGLLTWLAALGPPVFFYAFHVYTEVPAALALAASLALLLSSPGPGGAAAAGLLAATLPWLHVKMIGAAMALALVALLRLRGRSRAGFLAAVGVGAVAYLAHFALVFGRPTPLALYGGMPADMSGSPLRALAGLILDRSFGLLPHAPVFVLGLAGLFPLARRWRECWPCLLVGVAVVAPLLAWRMWWGGQSPPARFLVPLVPILGAALAARVGESAGGLSRWAWPLAATGLALGLFAAARPGELLLLNRGDRPTRLWAALSGEQPVGRYLPSLVAGTPEEWRVAAVWAGVLVFLLVLDRLAARRAQMDRLFRSLGLPLALLGLASVAIDFWARAPGR